MKILPLVLVALAFTNQVQAKISSDCTFNGIPLYGRVQIVNSFPDFKVKTVDAFSDLDVQVVKSFPDRCGKWQFVDAFPDFKIQIVSAPEFST